MDEQFEKILDECIDRILRGESVEACLQRYPQHASGLEPLLRLSQATHAALRFEPSSQKLAASRDKLLRAIRPKMPARSAWMLGWLRPRLGPAWAVALALFIVVFGLGAGTVAASTRSLPDQPLYPVKIATERVQLAVTHSESGKARLHTELAAKRLSEVSQMLSEGKERPASTSLVRFQHHMDRVRQLTSSVTVALGPQQPDSAAPVTITEATPTPTPQQQDVGQATPSPVPQTQLPTTPKSERDPKQGTPPQTHPARTPSPPQAERESSAPTRVPTERSPQPFTPPVRPVTTKQSEPTNVERRRQEQKIEEFKKFMREALKRDAEAKREAIKKVLENASPQVRERFKALLATIEEEYRKALDELDEIGEHDGEDEEDDKQEDSRNGPSQPQRTSPVPQRDKEGPRPPIPTPIRPTIPRTR